MCGPKGKKWGYRNNQSDCIWLRLVTSLTGDTVWSREFYNQPPLSALFSAQLKTATEENASRNMSHNSRREESKAWTPKRAPKSAPLFHLGVLGRWSSPWGTRGGTWRAAL